MNCADTSDEYDLSTFADFLGASSRVLCLNGLWNNINLKEFASPKKFREDPATVWNFYGDRLLESLAAQPNAAHHALAALAEWHEGWLTINQNVDGLLEQTNHPMSQLLGIHGTLKIVRCTTCDYSTNVHKPHDVPFLLSLSKKNDELHPEAPPYVPHCPTVPTPLREPEPPRKRDRSPYDAGPSKRSRQYDHDDDENVGQRGNRDQACDNDPENGRRSDQKPEGAIPNDDSETRAGGPAVLANLPHCPKCANLLRPGVVWFGERLAAGAPDSIDEWIAEGPIDLVIAAGTSLKVFPAAKWVHTAREEGASLAIFDMEFDHELEDELDDNDWLFEGDIAVILPRILNLLKL
ncbi:DHS-like NAD/FAD-binding domain-containing protein [Phaeosphaeriaceae sp. PMI808]|nr:DHS-like NAD/FAD-binding domain-containing protein [Phaeosphaeriaceae sp. PMI808]